ARLTAPPRAADNAPFQPQRSAANAVSTAVAMSCHKSTMRMGRSFGARTISAILRKTPEAKPFDYSVCAKTASKNRAVQHGRGESGALETLHQPLQLVEARVVDHHRALRRAARLELHRRAERFGELFLEPSSVCVERRCRCARGRRPGRLLDQA